jgi:hypothetical protein
VGLRQQIVPAMRSATGWPGVPAAATDIDLPIGVGHRAAHASSVRRDLRLSHLTTTKARPDP